MNGVENVVLKAVCLVDIENIGPPWGVSPVRTPAPAILQYTDIRHHITTDDGHGETSFLPLSPKILMNKEI